MAKNTYPKTDRIRELREQKWERDQAALRATASSPRPAVKPARRKRAKK
jgi:hypothetical protein